MGYVFTDLSADVIKIEPDAVGYVNIQNSYRRNGINNVQLTSYKEERSNKENNVLRSDFKKVLLDFIAREWTLTYWPSLFSWDEEEDSDSGYTSKIAENRRIAEKYIVLNVSRVQIEIPTDMNIYDDEKEFLVENKTGFARTNNELKQIFDKFCLSLLGGWSKSKCLSMLQNALLDALEQLFEIFETDAYKVVCSKQNQPKFADIISKALAYYKTSVLKKLLKADRGFIPCYWSVPESRDYKEETYKECGDVKNHALLPFFELRQASMPEKNFTEFLEQNTDYIDWWYKNGDSGSDNFAVLYENSQKRQALFYVDYIIRLKNGKVFLLDTKSENSDSEAPNKHNGLLEYLAEESNEDFVLKGGVTIEKFKNWKYSPLPIENTTEIDMWDTFNPGDE